jgi:hypothetical protein
MNSSAHVFLVSTYSISRASGVADRWIRAKNVFFYRFCFVPHWMHPAWLIGSNSSSDQSCSFLPISFLPILRCRCSSGKFTVAETDEISFLLWCLLQLETKKGEPQGKSLRLAFMIDHMWMRFSLLNFMKLADFNDTSVGDTLSSVADSSRKLRGVLDRLPPNGH